jgi:hypothetical protein
MVNHRAHSQLLIISRDASVQHRAGVRPGLIASTKAELKRPRVVLYGQHGASMLPPSLRRSSGALASAARRVERAGALAETCGNLYYSDGHSLTHAAH